MRTPRIAASPPRSSGVAPGFEVAIGEGEEDLREHPFRTAHSDGRNGNRNMEEGIHVGDQDTIRSVESQENGVKGGDGVRNTPIGSTREFNVGDRVRISRKGSFLDKAEGTVESIDVYELHLVRTPIGASWLHANFLLPVTETPAGAGPGAKDDSGKMRYDLIPTALEEGVAAVLTYGAFQRPRADGSKGYGKNNWQGVEDARGRYWAAMRRHLAAHRKGEKNDAESGLSHLSHAATNLAFLMSFETGHDPYL